MFEMHWFFTMFCLSCYIFITAAEKLRVTWELMILRFFVSFIPIINIIVLFKYAIPTVISIILEQDNDLDPPDHP